MIRYISFQLLTEYSSFIIKSEILQYVGSYFVTEFASGFDEWGIFMLGLYHYSNGEHTFFLQSRSQKTHSIRIMLCFGCSSFIFPSEIEGVAQLLTRITILKHYDTYVTNKTFINFFNYLLTFMIILHLSNCIYHNIILQINHWLAISITRNYSKQL